MYLSQSNRMFSLCLHSNHQIAELSGLYFKAWLKSCKRVCISAPNLCIQFLRLHACKNLESVCVNDRSLACRNTQFLCTIMVSVCATIMHLGALVFCVYIYLHMYNFGKSRPWCSPTVCSHWRISCSSPQPLQSVNTCHIQWFFFPSKLIFWLSHCKEETSTDYEETH